MSISFNLKGLRTFAVGLAIAVVPAALSYLAGFNWTSIVSPDVALAISGVITILLRTITTTPPGQST